MTDETKDILMAEEFQEDHDDTESPVNNVVQFAKDHPLALVAGGLVVGAAISALFPNSPTRKLGRKVSSSMGEAASAAGSKARVARGELEERGTAMAALATQMAISFGQNLLDSLIDAKDASKEKLSDANDYVAHARKAAVKTAKEVGGAAIDRISKKG